MGYEVAGLSVCMFTGHRPKNLPLGYCEDDIRCIKLKVLLKNLIKEKIVYGGISTFLTGMALGVDIFAAEAVLELRNLYPHVTLTAVLPCANQTVKWSVGDVVRYNAILNKCDNVIKLQQHYTNGCMNRRNLYMAKNSDCCIAVWNGSKGGTGNAVKFALELNLRITVLDPVTFEVYEI